MRKESKRTLTANVTQINSYHAQSDYTVQRANDFIGGARYFNSDRSVPLNEVENAKAITIEWEMTSNLTQDGNILATILKPELERLMPKNFFKFERDCTVDIEVVAQCATKEFWRNHYAEMKAIYSYLNTIQTYPNARRGASCGMHVNISVACFGKTREQQLKNIMKLHNLINLDMKHYKFMCDMFHRDRTQTAYCGKMTANELPPYNDHSNSMNYSHLDEGTASRLEIRLVGAQQTYGNWRNTMEVIFHLIKKCKELNENDFVNNPIKLWSGCNKYVYDRLRSVNDDVMLTTSQLRAIYDSMDNVEYI